MNKLLTLLVIAIVLSMSLIAAHEGEDFEKAKEIISKGTPCSELTDDDLEHIGDYYMEQMHPGEAHELMDEMMGGEGSAELKQMHVLMAKRIYCKEDVTVGSGMMNKGGMMTMMGTNYGYGMMGSSGWWTFSYVLYVLLLLGLVVLVFLWIIKLWKSLNERNSKR